MPLSTLIVSALDDPLPWVIAGITLGGTAIAFFTFLWFFRVIRLIVTKTSLTLRKNTEPRWNLLHG